MGTTITIITAGKVAGTFATVTIDGFKATVVYTSTGVQLHIDA